MSRLRYDMETDAQVKLMSIASGVAVIMQTANGLGRDISLLSGTQIVAFEKVQVLPRIQPSGLHIANRSSFLDIRSCLLLLFAGKTLMLHRLNMQTNSFISPRLP